MIKKIMGGLIILSSVCLSLPSQSIAQTIDFSQSAFAPIKTINPDEEKKLESGINIDLNRSTATSIRTIKLAKDDVAYNSTNATDKFVQCNIRNSWEDFKLLIKTAPENDFINIALANKMAGLGFFDLASIASKNIEDKEISSLSIDAMKRFYYPSRKLKLEDELILAEAYSNIIYNNQSSEATNELLKKESLLSSYDYANYLIALGSYKSNFFSQAAKYINLAIIQSPSTLNYYKLKAEILAEENKPEEAIKMVDFLKKQNLYSNEYERKILSLEQFVLYKTKKASWEKNYHLGYYYHIENDSPKAIRVLQSALAEKRNVNKGEIYGLMSEIYFDMKEYEKASDTALKAHKINSDNPKALLTLGNLSYMSNDYKKALVYYKKASAKDKKSYTPLVKQAQTYQQLANNKKAEEIYIKVLKTHSDSWEAYYNIALMNNDKKQAYLKKSLAVNPMFINGWIELAKFELEQENYVNAQKYLSNAFYIDENNFRYYYYQGLLCKNTGDYIQAKYNFKKSIKLNSSFKDAQTALDSIINIENNSPSQDNI